jgi:hypothetical protein
MTAVFLSPEWLDLHRTAGGELPARPGVSATVNHVITGGPDGNVTYTTTYQDGRVADVSPGGSATPDLTFAWSYETAQRVARGELETGAAFMQGTLKVEGNMAKLLPLLELMHHPEHRALVARLADQTAF